MRTKAVPTAKKNQNGSANTPKARVMFAMSKHIECLSTLIAQPNRYGPSLDVPLLVQPFRTRAQADKAMRFANLSYDKKVEGAAEELAAYAAHYKTDSLGNKGLAYWVKDVREDYCHQARAILGAMGVEP